MKNFLLSPKSFTLSCLGPCTVNVLTSIFFIIKIKILFNFSNIYIYIYISSFNFGNQLQPNITPASTATYGSTTSFSWAHTVPNFMPWVTQGDQQVPDPVMRFTAPFPPDPCTSQTATSWELLNNLGANKTNANMHLKRKSDLDSLE